MVLQSMANCAACKTQHTVGMHHDIKAYSGLEVQLCAFLTLALRSGELSASCHHLLYSRENGTGSLCLGWMGLRASCNEWKIQKCLLLLRIKPQSSKPQPSHYMKHRLICEKVHNCNTYKSSGF